MAEHEACVQQREVALAQKRELLQGWKRHKREAAASAREACLKAYKEDPSITVILISHKAGGVALNLTVASHIFLMDPWWNPAAEYQAMLASVGASGLVELAE